MLDYLNIFVNKKNLSIKDVKGNSAELFELFSSDLSLKVLKTYLEYDIKELFRKDTPLVVQIKNNRYILEITHLGKNLYKFSFFKNENVSALLETLDSFNLPAVLIKKDRIFSNDNFKKFISSQLDSKKISELYTLISSSTKNKILNFNVNDDFTLELRIRIINDKILAILFDSAIEHRLKTLLNFFINDKYLKDIFSNFKSTLKNHIKKILDITHFSAGGIKFFKTTLSNDILYNNLDIYKVNALPNQNPFPESETDICKNYYLFGKDKKMKVNLFNNRKIIIQPEQFLLVPIILKNNIEGYIYLYNDKKTLSIDELLYIFIKTSAKKIALFFELSEMYKDFELKNHFLNIINSLHIIFIDNFNQKNLVEKLLTKVQDFLTETNISIVSYYNKNKISRVIFKNGVFKELIFNTEKDIKNLPNIFVYELLKEQKEKTIMIVEKKEVTECDKRLFNTIAGYISIYLSNKELIKKVQKNTRKILEIEGMKSGILASISHEIKTPLTIIKATSEFLLLKEDITEYTKKYIQSILEEADRLTNLINKLIDLGVLMGNIGLWKSTKINPDNIISKIVKTYEKLIEEKRIKINLNLNFKTTFNAPADIIYHIFQNLIDNAIKYNKENGSITIETNAINEYFYASVSDTGIGIPSEDLPFIFNPFYRGELTNQRKFSGLGVGLTLTKRMIELLKGNIEVKSKKDKGTSFKITIPMETKSFI